MQPQSRLLIDLDVIRSNYQYVRTRVGQNCLVAGVVKANAYGLGVERVAPVLERAGCDFFLVATPYEAADLRQITQRPIGVLNPIIDAESADFMAASGIIPVLNSLRDIAEWQAHCRREETPFPAMIQFDTGMRRVGLSLADVKKIANDPSMIDGFTVHTMMSHFASADDDASLMTAMQHSRFEEMVKLMPAEKVRGAKLSLANSAGMMRKPAYHYDMVRPGRAIFGLQPLSGQNEPEIKNPVTLQARVIQVLDVKGGETVGYNETWKAPRDIKVATVSMGYADGLRRILTNRGNLFFNGRPLPITGRVSMDMVMVRIDHLNEAQPAPGEWVSFLCEKQTPDQVGRMAETNGYEILTGLGKRAQRLYTETGIVPDSIAAGTPLPATATGQDQAPDAERIKSDEWQKTA